MLIVTRQPTSNASPDPGQGAIADQILRRPGANQTPDPGQGGSTAVTSPSNNGHGNTTASSSGDELSYKSCLWSGIAPAGVTPASAIVKADWSQNGSVSGDSFNGFFIDYSLDGGVNWITDFHNASPVIGPSNGTAQAAIPTGQNLTQVRVRDSIQAQGDGVGGSASLTASVSAIRVELQANISAQAVSGQSNTGHGATVVSSNNDILSYRTCVWSGFQPHGVSPKQVKLKVDWSQNGALAGGGATNSFRIEYSLNNGSSWQILRDVSNINGSSVGTSEVTLSNFQDLTQVRVRSRMLADAPEGSSASLTVTISAIRIEVEYNPAQLIVMM